MSKRKLASIQEIQSIHPIKGADRIVLARILGWDVVVKKGEFEVGDACLYFEVDSFLPVDDERFEFLKHNSYKNNDVMGEGYRIKTQRLRKQLSQGLAFPVSLFPEVADAKVGEDVSETLGVKKWDMPEFLGNMGTITGDFPAHLEKTDELRVQSYQSLAEELNGQPYYISTKLDGTSCTVGIKDGKRFVASRNSMFKDDGKSAMWGYFHSIDGFFDRLEGLGQDIAIQGEFVGPGIQGNRLRLKQYDFFAFNVIDSTGNWVTYSDMKNILEELELNLIPIEEVGNQFNYTQDELLERAKGQYTSGINKEGIVIRPLEPVVSESTNKYLSFKVLNNDFLLKTED